MRNSLVGRNTYHDIQLCKFCVINCFQRRLVQFAEPRPLPLIWRQSGLSSLSSCSFYDDMQLQLQSEPSPTTSSPTTNSTVSSCQSPDFLHQQSLVEECGKRTATTGADKRWMHSDTKMLLSLIKEKWLLFKTPKQRT